MAAQKGVDNLPLYPAATIAKLFNLSERRVQQLGRDGVIPKPERGRYDLIGSVRGYVSYLQDRAFGKTGDATDMHMAKLKLLDAQAEEKRLIVEEKSERLISTREVTLLGQVIVASFSTKIASVHRNLRTRYPELDQDILNDIEQQHRGALQELGESGLHPEVTARLQRHNESLQAAAAAQDLGMGR